MRRTILWGATGQAKVVRDCLRGSDAEVVAVADAREVPPPFADVPLLVGRIAFERWLAGQTPAELGFLVTIGGARGRDRLEVHEYLESRGLRASIAVHSTAFVAPSARVGAGSQVLAKAAVCVEAVLGRGCIVNTAASVDHECRLADGVHVGPGARLAGCVEVGRCATIYTGAVVAPRVRIGADAVVGAGAVVLDDVPDGALVIGNPARVARRADAPQDAAAQDAAAQDAAAHDAAAHDAAAHDAAVHDAAAHDDGPPR